MSELRVTEAHSLGVEGAKKAIEPFLADLKKFGLSLSWSGSQAELKGPAASGNLSVSANAVTVVVKLGMMAKMLGVDAARLQRRIERDLHSALNPDPKA